MTSKSIEYRKIGTFMKEKKTLANARAPQGACNGFIHPTELFHARIVGFRSLFACMQRRWAEQHIFEFKVAVSPAVVAPVNEIWGGQIRRKDLRRHRIRHGRGGGQSQRRHDLATMTRDRQRTPERTAAVARPGSADMAAAAAAVGVTDITIPTAE